MAEPLLSVKNITAWYDRGKNVLSGCTAWLGEHEAVGLIGLNGAGKSTFLNILSGMMPTFDADEILFRGKPVRFRDKAFKTCRYTVFAEDHSFPYFTPREYADYVAAAYGRRLQGMEELIRGFGFADYMDVLLGELSTGNLKKAYLITAFALRPELLLLDEPVNGLDFDSTEYLYRLIAGYKEYGTILCASHILESITLTSDRVLVLEGGRIRQTFTGKEINAASIREALSDETNSQDICGEIIRERR